MRARVSVAVAGALALMLLQALPAALLLEYRRALLATEPWRLITGHAVHVNWTHALVNAAAWLLIERVFAAQLPARRQLLCVAIAAPAISLGLALLFSEIAWYRGASGVLHALFFAAATVMLLEAWRARRSTALAAALLAGGCVKLAVEWPTASEAPFVAWLGAAVVAQAHFLGALAGTAIGFVFGRRAPVRP